MSLSLLSKQFRQAIAADAGSYAMMMRPVHGDMKWIVLPCAKKVSNPGPPELFRVSDDEWEVIAVRLPCLKRRQARPSSYLKHYFEGMFWIASTGASWREMPQEYGNWNSAFRCFRRWASAGTLDAVAKALRKEIDAVGSDNSPASLERRALSSHRPDTQENERSNFPGEKRRRHRS
jgi:transposase